MNNFLFDARWCGEHGIGRFAHELQARIHFVRANLLASHLGFLGCVELSFLFLMSKKYFFSPGFNAPLFCGGRYVFTIHDLNHIDTGAGVLKKLYYELVIKRACRSAGAILTVSEFSRQRILDWSGISANKVVNVGNGVSSAFSPIGEHFKPGYSYLLCIGNRKPHKNEARVIEAFAMANIDSSINLVFNGDADDRLRSVAQTMGISDRVIFLGKLDELALASVYRGALGLVFPSLYEGFGFPIVEAMASGIPVVTSNVTSLPEVAGDAALLVDPLDLNQIADAITRLVNDSELRARLIEQGLDRVKAYSWDEVSRKVEKILKQVRLWNS